MSSGLKQKGRMSMHLLWCFIVPEHFVYIRFEISFLFYLDNFEILPILFWNPYFGNQFLYSYF